jgi:hypothetical protein
MCSKSAHQWLPPLDTEGSGLSLQANTISSLSFSWHQQQTVIQGCFCGEYQVC